MKCDVIKVIFVKLLDFSGYSARTTSKRTTCQKLAFRGKLSLKILAQLCSRDSIQVLLHLTRFITLKTEANLELCSVFHNQRVFFSIPSAGFIYFLHVFMSWAVKNVLILDTPWICLPDHL